MKNIPKLVLCAALLSMLPIEARESRSSCERESRGCRRRENHDVKFQLFDAYGFPVENTEFWTTVKLHKQRDRVTLSLPAINFQTGQYSADDLIPDELAGFSPPPRTIFEGGTLRSIDGFLPEDYRPTDALFRSFTVPSNNGQSLAFTYTTPYAELPVPPAGYILSISYAGELVIQGMGTFNNAIAPGPQIMLPTDVTYFHETKKKLFDNVVISNGASNITTFTSPASNLGYRDTHVNDAYGYVAYAWSDNSNVDQNQDTLNLMVAVGQVINGKLVMGDPVQLTNLPPDVMVWDTAVAINRKDPNNIVVSYGLLDNTNLNPSPVGSGTPTFPCRAVSYDGGKNWPEVFEYDSVFGSMSVTTSILTVDTVYNGSLSVGQTITPNYLAAGGYTPNTVILEQLSGDTYLVSNPQEIPDGTLMVASWPLNGIVPLNTQDSGGFGDNRGVGADKYGNIWYCTTNTYLFNQPIFWVSSDGGVTFGSSPAFTFEPFQINPTDYGWDFPQFCFGGDGSGNYGLWAAADYFYDPEGIYGFNSVGFLPIGSETFGSGDNLIFTSFENSLFVPCVTASQDGRFWVTGYSNNLNAYGPKTLLFKSPGSLDSNYAGVWQLAMTNGYAFFQEDFGASPLLYSSYPAIGYFDPVQIIIYDENRKALYALIAQNAPSLSQNMTLYLLISRDNGQTWSEPYYISSSDYANRGFQSMALDTLTGNLLIGWYDGRNDKTELSVEYYGAVLPAKKLDRMVYSIPLSNPLFNTGSAA